MLRGCKCVNWGTHQRAGLNVQVPLDGGALPSGCIGGGTLGAGGQFTQVGGALPRACTQTCTCTRNETFNVSPYQQE